MISYPATICLDKVISLSYEQVSDQEWIFALAWNQKRSYVPLGRMGNTEGTDLHWIKRKIDIATSAGHT